MGNKLIKMDCLSYAKNIDDERYECAHSQSTERLKLKSDDKSTSNTPSITKSSPNNHKEHQQQHHSKPRATSSELTANSKNYPHQKVPDKRYQNEDRSVSSKNTETKTASFTYCYIERKCIKVLFLDVDGVLNTRNTKWSEKTKGIEDKLLRYLKIILDKTKCKIVLSTAWRLYEQYKDILIHELKTRADINTNDIIIGETPSMPNCKRSTEISTFIHRYNSDMSNKYYIYNFAVIDDLPLHRYPNSRFLLPHFVRTDKYVGISIVNVVNCIQILNQYGNKSSKSQSHSYYFYAHNEQDFHVAVQQKQHKCSKCYYYQNAIVN